MTQISFRHPVRPTVILLLSVLVELALCAEPEITTTTSRGPKGTSGVVDRTTSSYEGLSKGGKIGVGIGVAAFVLIVATGTWWCLRRKKFDEYGNRIRQ